MKTVHEPTMNVGYPTPTGPDGYYDDRAVIAAEQRWMLAFPRQWLRNLKAATQEANDIEELRQIVAELIHVLLESMASDALKWPL